MKNQEIVTMLREIADLLEQQKANPFRVNAYRRAAITIEKQDHPITEVINRNGYEGLIDLPGIGEGIARSIVEFVATGHTSRLESLKAGNDPIAIFQKIPGVGVKLSHRIVEVLHIDTLEALEVASHNGRLIKVPGFSKNKVNMVKAWLAQVLGRGRQIEKDTDVVVEPPVKLLLNIDRQYRDKAGLKVLPTIAPKRFNPGGKKWLPIMHKTKEEWHFTVLFSNTARAHQLGHTRDWVIIYFYDKKHHEGQHTIVTETKGPLIGKRVVRGREDECMAHYFDRVG
ncbi:MAG: helix-hairpin-helix domain-containing protein [Arenicellales bacterium]